MEDQNKNVINGIKVDNIDYRINALLWQGLVPSEKQDTLYSGENGNIKTINGESILSENNTGGDINTYAISLTYSDLKKLKNDSKLIFGQQYKINDYETITSQENTRSGGETGSHKFDIIVTANSENTFDEIASACFNENDPYFKNMGADVNAWKIWYCFDNDTDRFKWAYSNGKGVIYRMIDEWGNDCPYDFKNIQFKRDSSWMNEHKSKFNSLVSSTQSELWFYTFSRTSGETTVSIIDDSLNNNLSDNVKPCRNNTIGVYSDVTKLGEVTVLSCILNNTIFIGNGAESNHFDENNYNNTFTGIKNNYFDMGCKNNIVCGEFSKNNIGINFTSNIILKSFVGNNIGNNFEKNNISGDFENNNIDNDFTLNEIYGLLSYCNIGSYFEDNNLNSFEYCNVGFGFSENTSLNDSTIKYCDFGNSINNCTDLPSMMNVIFDNEIINQENLGNITLSTGENALDTLRNLSNNTSKVLFTKYDNKYCVVYIAGYENKLESIYYLGSFATNEYGENEAKKINIIRNPKALFLKFYNESEEKNVFIQQMIFNHNCNDGEYGYAKQYKYLNGNVYSRKCWFINSSGSYKYVEDDEHNSAWVLIVDDNSILYTEGKKVINEEDAKNYVTLDREQTITGNKTFDKDINLAGKTIIKNGDDIDNGELKILNTTNSTGFAVKSFVKEEETSKEILEIELLGANSEVVYKYQFPTDLETKEDYIVVKSQHDTLKYRVKENEQVTASALNDLNNRCDEIKSGINNLKVDSLIKITYNQLLDAIEYSELIPGKKYRITDYKTVTSLENTSSANHRFDIIVTADSKNTLNELASACFNESDSYFKDNNVNIEAWQIWYCIKNNIDRFNWAETSECKGVIYRMIDEWGNDCPYDFKNIQFKRNVYMNGSGISKEENDMTTQKYCYTFSYEDKTGDIKDSSILVNKVYGNVIKYNGESQRTLNDIVFLNTKNINNICCYNNTFGNNCYSNTFENDCYNNTFGNGCYNNILGDYCYNNTFGNDCYNNTFGNECYNNTFGNNCYNNTFGNENCYNSLEDYCYDNTFGYMCVANYLKNQCYNNIFEQMCSLNNLGNVCLNNKLRESCNYNTFGNNCENNTFGNDCNNNTLGNECYDNKFGNENCYNSLEDSCHSNEFGYICVANYLKIQCENNKFGDNCFCNTIYEVCYNNEFGDNCFNNIFNFECCDNKLGHIFVNNTFGNSCYKNIFGNSCYNNTFGNGCYKNTFENSCNNNTFGNECDNNTFGNSCDNNTFGNECNENTFGENCVNNTLGNECNENRFGNECFYNTLDDKCKKNELRDSCTFNNLGIKCENNHLYDYCYNNTFGNECKDNYLYIGCTWNVFGDCCETNYLNPYCISNMFNIGCTRNTLLSNCYYNKFDNSCSNNELKMDCGNNTFGNICTNNTFGNYCTNNTFGNYCTDNTFGIECTNNTFGNYCTNNTFGNFCNNNTFGNECTKNAFLLADIKNEIYDNIDYVNNVIYENCVKNIWLYVDRTTNPTIDENTNIRNFNAKGGTSVGFDDRMNKPDLTFNVTNYIHDKNRYNKNYIILRNPSNNIGILCLTNLFDLIRT